MLSGQSQCNAVQGANQPESTYVNGAELFVDGGMIQV
jgi:hypothetical protein